MTLAIFKLLLRSIIIIIIIIITTSFIIVIIIIIIHVNIIINIFSRSYLLYTCNYIAFIIIITDIT